MSTIRHSLDIGDNQETHLSSSTEEHLNMPAQIVFDTYFFHCIPISRLIINAQDIVEVRHGLDSPIFRSMSVSSHSDECCAAIITLKGTFECQFTSESIALMFVRAIRNIIKSHARLHPVQCT
jgi:hypothetical protein